MKRENGKNREKESCAARREADTFEIFDLSSSPGPHPRAMVPIFCVAASAFVVTMHNINYSAISAPVRTLICSSLSDSPRRSCVARKNRIEAVCFERTRSVGRLRRGALRRKKCNIFYLAANAAKKKGEFTHSEHHAASQNREGKCSATKVRFIKMKYM